jgi:hypothetical protein
LEHPVIAHWNGGQPCPRCTRVQALADEASGRLVPSVTVSELNRARALSPAQTEGLTVAAVALVLEVAALAVAIWRWRR